MSDNARATGFTGWHMLAIMLAFFGVIISVNVTMAVFARTSWTGLVVQNSYVASQQFNEKMAETRAQAALGWTSDLVLSDGRARYRMLDRNQNGVPLRGVALTFKHPVDDREDQRIELVRDGDGSYTTGQVIADGQWLVEIEADAGREKPFRETLRIQIAKGVRQ